MDLEWHFASVDLNFSNTILCEFIIIFKTLLRDDEHVRLSVNSCHLGKEKTSFNAN